MLAVVYHVQEVPPAFGSIIDRLIYDCRNMGCDKLLVVDKTEHHTCDYYGNGDGLIDYETYSTLKEIEAAYPDSTFVYLEDGATIDEAGYAATELPDFNHPADAVYVVGPDFGQTAVLIPDREEKEWVTVPGINSIYAESVLAIVLHDRIQKG